MTFYERARQQFLTDQSSYDPTTGTSAISTPATASRVIQLSDVGYQRLVQAVNLLGSAVHDKGPEVQSLLGVVRGLLGLPLLEARDVLDRQALNTWRGICPVCGHADWRWQAGETVCNACAPEVETSPSISVWRTGT